MRTLFVVLLAVLSACDPAPTPTDAALPDSGVVASGEWRLSCGVRLDACMDIDGCPCPSHPPSVVVASAWCSPAESGWNLDFVGTNGSLTIGPVAVVDGALEVRPGCRVLVDTAGFRRESGCGCVTLREAGAGFEALLMSCGVMPLRMGSFDYTAEVDGLVSITGCP